ncbi:MAG: energy-coupling factor transporter transmembrane component T [Gemmatimonadota bacterium]
MTRRHPFTGGAVALAAIALAILLPAPGGTIALYLVICAGAAALGAGKAIRLGLLAVVPIWVLLFVMHGVLGEAPRFALPWGGTLSRAGVDWTIEQGSRLAAIVTASLAFAVRFDPHRFLQAAVARRWPWSAAFLLVATLDAADRFGEQAHRLREAQRTRGLRVKGSLRVRARAIPALVFPLLLTSLTEADDRALALESRGLTHHGPRTAIDPPADTHLDRTVRWASLAAVIAVAWWRVTAR